MANIITSNNIVDKHGRTSLNNDFWRAFVSNIPTGTATLNPDGVSDTTKYLQHLNGIFVGETDGTVYLGHGLKGNVNNVFNGINCGTLATGNYNYTGSGFENLRQNTTGFENSVGSGYKNLFLNTIGNNNAVGSGIYNMYSNTSGYYNSVGSGMKNLYSNTTGRYNSVGAGSDNLYSNTTGQYNSVGAGFDNLYSMTTGQQNSVGSGYRNLYYSTTSSFNSVGSGYRNAYFNTTGQYIAIGAGNDNFLCSKTGSFNSVGAGSEVFLAANHSHLTGEGYKAGKNLIGNNNTSIGSLSNFLSDIATASPKTYTIATNNTITSTSHGFAVGSIVIFGNKLGAITNTEPPFYFKAIDANTLETYPNTLTNLTVGQTYTGSINITTVVDYTNATALGYATKNTKSNQVALGDSNVTELLLGGTLAIDKASLVGAADGTPIVIRTIGGVKTITV